MLRLPSVTSLSLNRKHRIFQLPFPLLFILLTVPVDVFKVDILCVWDMKCSRSVMQSFVALGYYFHPADLYNDVLTNKPFPN